MLVVAEQAFRSDTGRQRTANEDSLFARAPLFAVADGMGGAQAGEVASRIAAESFEPAVREQGSPEAFLKRIAEDANRQIHTLAQRDSSRQGMGTTLTAALVEGDEVSFAHVGDSRGYIWRDGELKLLTSDHSLVEELRRQGRLTEAQAQEHPQRSIITRALGPESEVEIDTLTFSARPGDVFLLCSDGLTTMIKDDEISSILADSANLVDATTRLVRAANEAGGRDNITVVAFRLADAEDLAPEEGATLIGPSAEEAGLTAAAVRAGTTTNVPAASSASLPGADGSGGTTTPPAAVGSGPRSRLLAVAVVLAAIVVGAWLGARQVYFLGTDEGGRLTLYRGLPYELPFGAELYSEVYSIPTQVSSLPEDRRESAIDHELRGRDDAVSLLDDLQRAAITTTPSSSTTGGGGTGGSREAGLSGRKSPGSTGPGDDGGGQNAPANGG